MTGTDAMSLDHDALQPVDASVCPFYFEMAVDRHGSAAQGFEKLTVYYLF